MLPHFHVVAREMSRPCANLCRGRLGWHKVPRHKVTRHNVTRHKVLAQGCRHKALAPGREHISWPRTDYENDNSPMQNYSMCSKHFENFENDNGPCISSDSEASRQLPTHLPPYPPPTHDSWLIFTLLTHAPCPPFLASDAGVGIGTLIGDSHIAT